MMFNRATFRILKETPVKGFVLATFSPCAADVLSYAGTRRFGIIARGSTSVKVLNPYGGWPIPTEQLQNGRYGSLLASAAGRLQASDDEEPTEGSNNAGSSSDGSSSGRGVVLRAHSPREVQSVVAAALLAHREWALVRLPERLGVVQRFRQLLEGLQGQELAQILCEETGKPLRQARMEVRLAAGRVRQMEGMLQQLPFTLAGEEAAAAAGSGLTDPRFTVARGGQRRREFVEWEPVGVVASLSAWNFPVVLHCDVAAPALALGNALLVKPSEHAVLVGLALADMWRRSGLPRDLCTAIVGGPPQGEAVVTAPQVGTVLFTGSRAGGRAVAAAVAGRDVPVPVQLELGGKDAVYVHSDVITSREGHPLRPEGRQGGAVSSGSGSDETEGWRALGRVAAAIADAAFSNSGQVCCGPKLVFAAEGLAAPLARLLAERAVTLRAGEPADPSLDVQLGPLARRQAAEELRTLVDEALAAGAVDVVQEVLSEPGRAHGEHPSGGAASAAAASWAAAEAAAGGFFFAPRVLVGVREGMRVVTEETFGPVLCVQAVSSPEEAAARMSRSKYGLTAACYSRDEQVARRLLRTADVGSVFWNGGGEMPVGLPWSGRRWSGLGFQLGGTEGLKTFLRPKSHVFSAFPTARGP